MAENGAVYVITGFSLDRTSQLRVRQSRICSGSIICPRYRPYRVGGCWIIFSACYKFKVLEDRVFIAQSSRSLRLLTDHGLLHPFVALASFAEACCQSMPWRLLRRLLADMVSNLKCLHDDQLPNCMHLFAWCFLYIYSNEYGCICRKDSLVCSYVWAGEKLKESGEDAKEGNGEKERNGTFESNNRSHHGAIVPALGPRPDRVQNVSFSGFFFLISVEMNSSYSMPIIH